MAFDMKKIMFNDRYGLTNAVLEGRKTMTREVVADKTLIDVMVYTTSRGIKLDDYLIEKAPYKVGEVVAVAQSYVDVIDYYRDSTNSTCVGHCEYDCGKATELLYELESFTHKGFTNKMFVRADLMPHQIKMTNLWVKNLQDISDEDCFKEGISRLSDTHVLNADEWEQGYFYIDRGTRCRFATPRECFISLIDNISGKGTWSNNPYVFVYEFELIR